MMISELLVVLLVSIAFTFAWKMTGNSKSAIGGWIVTFIISSGIIISGTLLIRSGVGKELFNYITTTRVF